MPIAAPSEAFNSRRLDAEKGVCAHSERDANLPPARSARPRLQTAEFAGNENYSVAVDVRGDTKSRLAARHTWAWTGPLDAPASSPNL